MRVGTGAMPGIEEERGASAVELLELAPTRPSLPLTPTPLPAGEGLGTWLGAWPGPGFAFVGCAGAGVGDAGGIAGAVPEGTPSSPSFSGIFPSRYASKILRAIGPAVLPP